MNPELLPAILVGIEDRIGLAILRDLGKHGVRIHGIAADCTAIGLASRYLHAGHIRAKEENAFIDQLVALGKELGQACLIAFSEFDIKLLNRYRERFNAFRILFPDEAHMQQVLNKEQTFAIAEKVGVMVPSTEKVLSIDDAASLANTLKFPVVLKWENPVSASEVLARNALNFEKAHYCYTSAELLAYLSQFTPINLFPIIQEYIPGFGLGQCILMVNGELSYAFQHRRIHEFPPEGGVSSLCESTKLDRILLAKSSTLLHALDWDGVAMVEYRVNRNTGEAVLMEVNGRFWGSLALACFSGANFPWFAYQTCMLKHPIPVNRYRTGIRCRCMDEETKRLIRIVFQPGKIADRSLVFRRIPEMLKYLGGFFRPRTHYSVLQWNDPLPFLCSIRIRLSRIFSRLPR